MNALTSLLRPDSVRVFLFHGVISRRRDGVRNYTGKHMPLDEFANVIRDLSLSGTPASMTDVAAFCAGTADLAAASFAVTFDDGFENNYSVAAPVLAELGVPATFYVTSGFVENDSSSWIDLIEYAVERADCFSLRLPFDQPRAVYRTQEEKIALLDAVRARTKADASINPYDLADDIWQQLGIARLEPDSELDAKLSWPQVTELSRHELFTIGGHGLTHRILEHLDDDELAREIEVGLTLMRDHVAEAVEHFSYPEGLAHCYSDRVIAALRREGITCATTAEPTENRPGTDVFRIGRHLVA